jgi:hypothetical protein
LQWNITTAAATAAAAAVQVLTILIIHPASKPGSCSRQGLLGQLLVARPVSKRIQAAALPDRLLPLLELGLLQRRITSCSSSTPGSSSVCCSGLVHHFPHQ